MPRRSYENKTIEVILLQADKHLGEKYEVVRVKPIYAQNVLLPKGIAVLATTGNLNNYKAKMEAAKKDIKKKIENIDTLFAEVQQKGGVQMSRKVNEKDTFYDKVGADDIVAAINEQFKGNVDTHCIKLKKNISEPGDYNVAFKYKEIEKTFLVVIKGEGKVAPEKKEEKAEETKEDSAEETK